MSQESGASTQYDQSWQSNPKWAGGQIVDDPRSGMLAMWAFAGIWNAFVWPVAIVVLVRNDLTKQPIALAILLFPLAGLAVAYAALRQNLRHRRFGVSVLKLDRMPASPGTVVAGTISVPTAFNNASVQVRLYCTHRRITGSGEHQRTNESTLWEDEQEVHSKDDAGRAGTAIAFGFNLPVNVPLSDLTNTYDQRLWRVLATSKLPGMEYRAKFEIPVYETAASSQAKETPLSEPNKPLPEPAHVKPTEPGVTVTKRIDGGWDIHFAAGRDKTAIKVVGVLLVIFAAVAVGVGFVARSYFFGAVFGFFALLCLIGFWQLLFAQTAVTVSRGMLKVRKWSPVYSATREWSAGKVENITFKITAQVGDKPYYSVRIRHQGDRITTVGSGIASKRDARWIVDRLRESLRLPAISDAEEIRN